MLLAFQIGDEPRVLTNAFGHDVHLTFTRRQPKPRGAARCGGEAVGERVSVFHLMNQRPLWRPGCERVFSSIESHC